MAKKYDLRLHKVEGELSVRTETYGNGNRSVYGRVDASIEIDAVYMMRIIEENWTSIDPDVRHKFARKVSVLDFQDAVRQGNPDQEEAEEEGFKWNKW